MNTAILISSCDKFKDCWEPMIFSIKKYWPDCPFSIYFISNYEEIEDDKIKFIKVGEDLGFCSNLKNAISSIETKYVIYFQDDYFLTENVNNDTILNHINYCNDNDINFLKIHSNDFFYRDNFRINNSDYCNNPIDVRYSINTAIAIWDKNLLLTLCIDGYNGWQWERNIINYIKENNINIRSQVIHSSMKDDLTIKTIEGGAVMKGKWTIQGYEFLKQYGFNSLINKRNVEGKFINYLAKKYNHNPKSILRLPIAVTLRLLLKFKVNI